jgi:hypothetical protein
MAVKRLLFSVAVLCATFFGARAQFFDPYWQWAKADTPASLSYSGGYSVLTAKNNKILWGRLTANQTVVNSQILGTWTFTEYDTSGKTTASAAFGGKVEMIDAQVDAAGNWYILGRFWDSLVLPTTVLMRPNPATNPDADHFVVKLRAGSFFMDWYTRIGTLKATSSRAFTIDNSSIIIAVDSSDATYVRRMSFVDGSMTPLFKQGGKTTTTSIQTDASGNIYMAGSCATKGTLDFNGVAEPIPPGTSKAYIARYLATGAHSWHRLLHDPTCAARKLTLFKNQFLYYTGTLNDSLSIGAMSLHPPLKSLDFVSARLDPNTGNPIWLHQVDTAGQGEAFLGTAAYHAAVTPDTALVVYPQANSYMDWGNGITTNLFGTYSSVVVSTGADGMTRWARSVFAENVTDDRLASDGNGVYVCGSAFTTTAVTRFDTLNLKMPARKWVPYLAKLNLIRPPFVGPGAVGNVSGNTFSAYPNPTRNAIRVTGLIGKSELVLRDLSGRAVLTQSTEKSDAVLNVADLPRGTYFLHLKAGADAVPQVQKVVLQ